jgi:hypothetical protein
LARFDRSVTPALDGLTPGTDVLLPPKRRTSRTATAELRRRVNDQEREVRIARRTRQASTPPIETADRIDPTERNDPIEPIEPKDPIEPTDSAEPVEPMDSTEPLE